jgi:hypothetical protein
MDFFGFTTKSLLSSNDVADCFQFGVKLALLNGHLTFPDQRYLKVPPFLTQKYTHFPHTVYLRVS